MQSAGTALVAGIEGTQQVDHLGSTTLADHQPIGAHPECLPDEVAQANRASALHIGCARLQGDHVRVDRAQLGGVFDHHDALGDRYQAEQGVEQRRLSRAGAACHQVCQTGCHDACQQRRDRPRHGALVDQLVEAERALPERAQRQVGTGGRDRRKHRVQAGAVGQPRVDVRACVVEPPAAARREPLRQPAHLVGATDHRGHPFQPGAPVDPYVTAVDQHVGDLRIGEERREWARSDEITVDSGGEPQYS
ncbi:hypothetical protein Pa4123_36040 [Phytohabitans aurantiacus]|uniref:Uncharacterized protein n=1 Tax=Phytohabitans aurantiacus TaxID=3016789 RepID=A0ABQ5QVW1_9ACTN|nr:hypothetical protein Pa4123_36040 [Phytohabitans aurantiacus]